MFIIQRVLRSFFATTFAAIEAAARRQRAVVTLLAQRRNKERNKSLGDPTAAHSQQGWNAMSIQGSTIYTIYDIISKCIEANLGIVLG